MKDFEKTVGAIVSKRKAELPSSQNSLKDLTEKLEKISELTPLLEKDLNEALNEYLGGRKLENAERRTVEEMFQRAIRDFVS